jgi:monoamine oxidase
MAAKILVIGAGAAGLLSSHLLLQKGYDVTVLEARARTGGRIQSVKKRFTTPLEAGAEFIHGKLPFTLKLLEEARLKERKVEGKFYEFVNGEYQDAAFLNEEIEEVSKIMEELKGDMTFSKFIEENLANSRHDKAIKYLLKLVEGYDGADPSKISTFALRDEWSEWNDEDDLRIEGNYSGIIRHLEGSIISAGGKIKLSSPVEQINWQKQEVTVTAAGETFSAEKIILTVPVSILQQNKIVFSPEIPSHTNASRDIGFGAVIKFLFEFKKDVEKLPSYKKIKDLRFIFSDLSIPTWWSQLPQSSRIFTGWLGGPKAWSFPREPKQQYVIAIKCLSSMLNTTSEHIESLLLDWHIEDWVADPFSNGAYAYATPQTNEARKILNKPIEETLFFAGEAISEGDSMGTVEAAFESAVEVVKRIHKVST